MRVVNKKKMFYYVKGAISCWLIANIVLELLVYNYLLFLLTSLQSSVQARGNHDNRAYRAGEVVSFNKCTSYTRLLFLSNRSKIVATACKCNSSIINCALDRATKIHKSNKKAIFALACLSNPLVSWFSLSISLFLSFGDLIFHIVKWSKWSCARMPEAFDLKRMQSHTWVRLIFTVMGCQIRKRFSFFFFISLSLCLFCLSLSLLLYIFIFSFLSNCCF